MAKPSKASITFRRSVDGVLGFDCTCGYSYSVPASITSGPYRNGAHAGNLADSMVRYHENKHKLGKVEP